MGSGDPWCGLGARGHGKQILGKFRMSRAPAARLPCLCLCLHSHSHGRSSELGPALPCPASVPSSSKADFRLFQQDQLLCTSCFRVPAEPRCLCPFLGLAVIAIKMELKWFGVVFSPCNFSSNYKVRVCFTMRFSSWRVLSI